MPRGAGYEKFRKRTKRGVGVGKGVTEEAEKSLEGAGGGPFGGGW